MITASKRNLSGLLAYYSVVLITQQAGGVSGSGQKRENCRRPGGLEEGTIFLVDFARVMIFNIIFYCREGRIAQLARATGS